jgi:ribonuclease BN (tRNA processing enzyme)
MPFSLTVLGTAAPYPRPDQPCSGYLLRADGVQVMVDAGPGTLAALQRHTGPERLTAVWVSHLHADHAADLVSLLYALAYGGLRRPAPLPVYAPPGWAGRLAGFFQQESADFLDGIFEVHELYDGHRLELNGLELLSRAVRHDIESYALRASYRGGTLVYSGDSGPCAALDELATGADVLLCEADADRWPEGTEQVHMTPEDTGALARRAGVGRLIVTHAGPTLTLPVAAQRAAAVFPGPTLTAREDDSHPIG